MGRPVVVMAGRAKAAVEVAVSEATARRCPVVALVRPADGSVAYPLGVIPEVVGDDVVGALVQASATAELLVVARWPGDENDIERVAAHAACPVLTVDRITTGPGGRAAVVLAVDARARAATAAAEFAFGEAARRRVDLTVVYVAPAQPGGGLTTVDPFAYDNGAAMAEADRLLSEAIVGWSDRYPDVVVHRRAFHDPDVVKALAVVAADAGLLVVASRDHPRLSERLLGSVTAGVLGHATCPVAVVPATTAAER